MEETIVFIKYISDKNSIDYLAIFAPITLSIVAIAISLWDSLWSQRVKKLKRT